MKILLIFLLFNTSFAANLMHCLGQEENFYAKRKYTGPSYKLNQILIEEISSLSNLVMTQKAFDRVCTSSKESPSLKLLQELVLNEIQIFEREQSTGFEFITLKSLRDNSGQILIKYITLIQTLSSDPKCIERKVPDVKRLYSRYKYLEDEISTKQLMGSKTEINRIFSALYNVDKILKACEKDMAKNKK